MATSTIDLSISYPNMETKTLRLLSVLGKRFVDKEGNSTFSMVQIGTAEQPLISDFVHKALHDVVARIASLISNYDEDENVVTFSVTNSRWGTEEAVGLNKTFAYTIIDYCVSTAIADYLALYFPSQSSFYKSRAVEIMNNIISICYFKQPSVAVQYSYLEQ